MQQRPLSAPALRLYRPLAALAALLLLLAPTPASAQLPARVELLEPDISEVYGLYPGTSDVPEEFTLTNTSTDGILEALASHPGRARAERTVIFTTLRFGDGPEAEVLGMVASWCSHLHARGLLQHAMLITTDDWTWGLLRSRGLPAYLDRSLPRRSAYIKDVKPSDTYNREFDVQKHWWGWRLSSLGFRALYMDSDAVVLRDPLPLLDEPYDVQGLSDWENLEAPDLKPGVMWNHVCTLYYAVAEKRMASGSIWREGFHLAPGTPAFLQQNPCQSTGVWLLQPTPATVFFMRAVVDRIAYHATYQWDQTAWNEIVTTHLWGMGDYRALHYRLLPFTLCSNILTHRARKAKGLPVRPMILHLGGIYGSEKVKTWEEESLFNGNFSLPAGAAQRGSAAAAAGYRGWYAASGAGGVSADVAARLGSAPKLWLLMVPLCVIVAVALARMAPKRAARLIPGLRCNGHASRASAV